MPKIVKDNKAKKLTDLQLIEDIYKGDKEAFQHLVEKYKNLIYKASFGILQNKEDAEDITQDVFVEVFHSIADFRKESQISTWLYRIAINKSINLAKRNSRRNRLKLTGLQNDGVKDQLAEIPDTGSKNMDVVLEDIDRKKIIMYCLQKLPKNQKIAFTLSRYDHLSYKEISEIMDVSLSAVESLIHRAKSTLVNSLTKTYKKMIF